jgi:hypothetical protein
MIVNISPGAGKIRKIYWAGGPAEPQSWWWGRQHTTSKLFCGGQHNDSKFLPVQARYGQYFELEDPLSPSPGGEADGILLVNFSVVGGITIVNFSSNIGKISAILPSGGPAEPQPWCRGRRHTASKFSVVGGITILDFSSDVGKISTILRAGGPAEPQPWWRSRRWHGWGAHTYGDTGKIPCARSKFKKSQTIHTIFLFFKITGIMDWFKKL